MTAPAGARSDAGSAPRHARQNSRQLHTLVERAAEAGPFVLVGHSIGGLNARMYADLYPHEVVGIVLIDAAHPDQSTRLGSDAQSRRPSTGAHRLDRRRAQHLPARRQTWFIVGSSRCSCTSSPAQTAPVRPSRRRRKRKVLPHDPGGSRPRSGDRDRRGEPATALGRSPRAHCRRARCRRRRCGILRASTNAPHRWPDAQTEEKRDERKVS